MTDELLRDLAKDLPFERPTAARRDAIRSSLLVEAAESTDARPVTSTRRWASRQIVAAFTAGALVAAAIALIVVRPSEPSIDRTNLAQVTATSPDVRIDHQIVATDTGSDEIVRIREGTIALAIPAQRRGDRVIVQTTTASVEGDAGDLEVTVAADQLQQVRVKAGTARVIVIGQAPVVLSAGQTWRASVITADLSQTRTQTESTQPPSQAEPPLARTDPPAIAPTATEVSKLADTDGSTSKPTAAPTSAVIAAAPTIAAPKAAITPAPTPTSAASKSAVTAAPPPTTSAPKSAVTAAPTPTTAAPKSAVTAPTLATQAPKSAVAEPPTPTTQAPKPAVTEAPKSASIEQRFKRGWELLRAGKAQQAADELGAAADASPGAPLAADARYFQAVALVRANDPRAAERVLVQFLDSAPKSLRRGRAAVLLGRLLAERGDTKSARAWLETAANDPDPAIAAAAKAGLQALR